MSITPISTKHSESWQELSGGLYAAILTPFTKDGATVDHDALAQLVEHNLNQGLQGIYAGGSSAEAFLLSDEERMATFRTVACAAHGRCRLIAHVGSISLHAAQTMARQAAAAGFDAISSIPPFYYNFSFAEIHGYYKTLAATVDLPFVLYHFPDLCGVRFSLDQISQLLAIPNVTAVKYTDSDYYMLEQLHRRFPQLTIFNGYDETMLPGLLMGASGGIGTTYNIQGAKFIQLCALIEAGEIEQACQLQAQINALIDLLVRHGVLASTKFLLGLQGIAAGSCRAPFAPLTDDAKVVLTRFTEQCL